MKTKKEDAMNANTVLRFEEQSEEFLAAMQSGQPFEMDEESFYYWLEVLPPTYIAEFGNDSWELDALEPKVIVALVERSVQKLIDKKAWEEDKARMKSERELLEKAAGRWPEVVEFLNGGGSDEE
jgi:hypothetical protein